MGMMAISFVFFLLWTAVYAVLLVQMPLSVVTCLLGLPVCVWLSDLLHELAHLAAYLCLRIPFRRLRLSWFLFRKEDDGVHFRFEPKAMPFLAECACVYNQNIPAWKYCIALVCGGLLCAIVCPLVLWLSFLTSGALASFLLCLGIATGLNAAVNLLYPHSADMTLLRRLCCKKREDT